jgi:hypothetical protein
MENVEGTVDGVLKLWPVFTTLFGILLYAHQAKRIEILKLRIGFMLDAYGTLAQMHASIRSWAHPMGEMSEKDKNLDKDLTEIWPKAEMAINKASLVVDPSLIGEMRQMFQQTNVMLAEYANWKMFLDAQRDGADYRKEVKKSFTVSRKELPAKMEKILGKILRKFQCDLNGRATVWWWDLRNCCYRESAQTPGKES